MTTDGVETRRPPLWWILLRHEWRLTIRSFGSFGAGKRGPGFMIGMLSTIVLGLLGAYGVVMALLSGG